MIFFFIMLSHVGMLLLSASCSLLFLLGDEGFCHDAQLLHLSALLLGQVFHRLLGVKAGPGGAVAVNLPLVLPRLECALESLGAQRWHRFGPRVMYEI